MADDKKKAFARNLSKLASTKKPAPLKREGFSKKGKKIEHSLYAPGYTRHFAKGLKRGTQGLSDRGYHKGLGGSEGGQGGLVYSQKRTKPGKKGGTVYSVGALQNSYGDLIGAGTVGREWTLGKKGKTKVGIHGGGTVGYKKSFDRQVKQQKASGERFQDKEGNWTRDYSRQLDKGFIGATRKSGVTPVVNASVSRKIGKNLEAQALVNPLYVNAGLRYNFGGKKKGKKKRRR